MTQEEFEKVFEGRLEMCRRILMQKNVEYARGDKLHNFKAAADKFGITPEQALAGMWIKHVQSIWDMCDDLELNVHSKRESWDEKIGDALNYLFLLHALLEERYRG
jgi:hypothetical protein